VKARLHQSPNDVPSQSLDARHSRQLRKILIRRRPPDRFRQTEVQHFHSAFGRDFHVGRFQVAVDDAFVMRGSYCFCDLLGKSQGLGEGQRASFQAIGQGDALHQLHHQAIDTAGFFQAVNGRDVRVVQGGQSASLAAEARQPFRVACELTRQSLDGDVSAEFAIVRPIYLAHAACA